MKLLALSMLAPGLVAATVATAAAEPVPEPNPATEVFFDFDSSMLRPGADALLAEIAAFAKQSCDAKIIVDGHTDPVGTAAYNAGLSARRAEAVREQLVAMGVPRERMYLGMYGENGIARSTHALDRRVTVWATEAPLDELVAGTLHRGVAMVWDEPVTAAEIDGRPEQVEAVAIAEDEQAVEVDVEVESVEVDADLGDDLGGAPAEDLGQPLAPE